MRDATLMMRVVRGRYAATDNALAAACAPCASSAGARRSAPGAASSDGHSLKRSSRQEEAEEEEVGRGRHDYRKRVRGCPGGVGSLVRTVFFFFFFSRQLSRRAADRRTPQLSPLPHRRPAAACGWTRWWWAAAGAPFWAAHIAVMDLASSDETASGGVRVAERVLHSDLSALISTSELHRLLESCKDEQELRAEGELCSVRLSAVQSVREQQARVKQQAHVARSPLRVAPRTAYRTHFAFKEARASASVRLRLPLPELHPCPRPAAADRSQRAVRGGGEAMARRALAKRRRAAPVALLQLGHGDPPMRERGPTAHLL
eukprot:3748412-Prymnesium_polylepis.2